MPGRIPDDCEVHWIESLAATEVEDLLSPEERARARALRRPQDRASFAATRGALRELIGRRVGVAPAQLVFVTGEHGKPGLLFPAREREIHFNVAHCEGHAVIALRDGGPVGVDVEPVPASLPDRDEVARRVLSPRELRWLRGRPEAERTRDFVRLWVLKEAFAKCLGVGLSGPLEELETDMNGEGPRAVRWRGHTGRAFVAVELPRGDRVVAALVAEVLP